MEGLLIFIVVAALLVFAVKKIWPSKDTDPKQNPTPTPDPTDDSGDEDEEEL
jgi:hypothetical protein